MASPSIVPDSPDEGNTERLFKHEDQSLLQRLHLEPTEIGVGIVTAHIVEDTERVCAALAVVLRKCEEQQG